MAHGDVAGGPLNWVTINAFYADPELPKVWLATQLGVMALDTRWSPGVRVRPGWSAWIREVTAAQNRPVFSGAWAGGPERRWTRQETALRFSYAAPAYATDHAGRSQTRYRTRLDGFDREWSPWTVETAATYTNLPGGRFAFRVQARDVLGRESAEASLVFALPPPWWLSGWAWLGYGGLAGGAFFGGVRWRTAVLRRKNRQLEQVVAARTADLRRKNAELARLHRLELDEKITARLAAEKARLEVLRYQLNPHFLFNSLSAIRSQIPPALAGARSTLDRLTEFCRLTLQGDRPHDRTVVAEEIAMLRSYLDIEQARKAGLLSVEFAIGAGVGDDELPRLLLLPLVENALKYGAATSEETVALKVAVRREGAAGLCIEIGNTGTWVEPGARAGVPSLGIGLHNLRERLRRHYPERHEFAHRAAAGWVWVVVRLLGPAEATPQSGPRVQGQPR